MTIMFNFLFVLTRLALDGKVNDIYFMFHFMYCFF